MKSCLKGAAFFLLPGFVLLVTSFVAPAHAEGAANGKKAVTSPAPAQVRASWSGGGWKITRTYEGETKAFLSLRSDGAERTIEGSKQGANWVFWAASEQPKDTKTVELEFTLHHAGGPEEKQRLLDFVQAAATAIVSAYDSTATFANKEREARVALGNELTREKLTELLADDPLQGLMVDGERADEQLLLRLDLRKTPKDQWELSADALARLREYIPLWEDKQMLALLKKPELTCLAPKEPKKQLESCFNALQEGVKNSQPAEGGPAMTEQQQAQQKSAVDFVGKISSDQLRGEQLWNTFIDPSAGNEAGDEESHGYLGMSKLAGPKVQLLLRHKSRAVQESASAITWLASSAYYARQVEIQSAAWTDFLVDGADLESFEIDTRSAENASLEVEPGLPRFFFSTGLSVVFLDDRAKLGLPILASVCLSPSGCQTKGISAKSKVAEHIGLDIGVNVTTFGKKEPRFGSPVFMVGGGFTPIYATHLSIGGMIFENPQSGRVNAAPYISLTLDLVDGAQILGGLGIGKPKANVNLAEDKEKKE